MTDLMHAMNEDGTNLFGMTEEEVKTWDKETKSYCTQNNGDCSSCSLVNYGRDCQNNPV